MKVGRNDPCPCGSGKKYKRCCGAAGASGARSDPAAHRARAVAALERGDYQRALGAAQQVLAASPNDEQAHLAAGLAYAHSGQPGRALPHLERAVRRRADNPDIHIEIAAVHEALGQWQRAAHSYGTASRLAPARPELHHALGRVLKHAGRLDEAEQHYREAVRLAPHDATYRYSLGSLQIMRADTHDARAQLEAAVERDPALAAAWVNLGALHLQLGEYDLAHERLAHAVELTPDDAQALVNLGLALHHRGQTAAAVENYRRALQLEPGLACTYSNNLISALLDLNDLAGAHAIATDVLEHASERKNSLSAAISAFGATCDFARRELAQRRWHALVRDQSLPVDGLLECNYTTVFDPDELYALHRRWANALAPAAAPAHAAPARRGADARLRVAYLSADFREHAVARFLLPILGHHDRSRFEIHAYHTHRSQDAVTDRVRACCDRFVHVRGLDDAALAARIRADGIDILVDLAGHTGGGRLEMMAGRPAPIQASYLGYPNTTGLQAIDYVIVDQYVAAAGGAWHSEALALLPECLVTFQPLPLQPDRSAPAVAGGHVTFGSLNNLKKITSEVIACWAAVLNAVPDAMMLIAYKGADAPFTREQLVAAFAEHGVTAERLQLEGERAAREDFLQRYRRIDIFLDTFPYTGTTTTCEALCMHVPLVTLAGVTQRERISASILTQVGLGDLIAATPAQYVEIAVTLAQDPRALARARNTLAARLPESVLRQPARFTGDLERLYRAMWARHERGEATREPLLA